MTRKITRVGDVFFVKVNDKSKKYFQYVISDHTQLNSDVIRVFKEVYPLHDDPRLQDVIEGEVEFYAHCVTALGLKMGYWAFAGNASEVGDTDGILFRDTNDYGTRPGEQIRVSDSWYVWHVNDDDFTRIGKLEGEYRNAEVGIVVSPDSIVHRIQTGNYDFVYPDYQ